MRAHAFNSPSTVRVPASNSVHTFSNLAWICIVDFLWNRWTLFSERSRIPSCTVRVSRCSSFTTLYIGRFAVIATRLSLACQDSPSLLVRIDLQYADQACGGHTLLLIQVHSTYWTNNTSCCFFARSFSLSKAKGMLCAGRKANSWYACKIDEYCLSAYMLLLDPIHITCVTALGINWTCSHDAALPHQK